MSSSPNLYLLIALAPLAGAILAGLFGTGFLGRPIGRRASHVITILGVLISAIGSVVVLGDVLNGLRFDGAVYTWSLIGQTKLEIGFLIDPLSAMMMVVVTSVSLMVHIYTIGYMADDPGYQRFFSYISLFTFSMLMLVMSNNMVQLFFGWEAVGLVSYLLIGFWYTRPTAIFANMKAFLINRVGDFGFVLGIGLLFAYAGTMHYGEVFAQADKLSKLTLPGSDWMLLTVACICLFIGAMGKSAQVPLHAWLPDSMEGPTPISALIHAATMVTAGIFMVARFSPLFELSDTALSFIIVIGAIGALFLGILGIIQNDIKRVVAYSTLSQLGYMTVALGASAYSVAIFHLMTHAFFKALLFLGAGSVIIGMHHDQDIRNMGGLRKYMPITWITFLLGTLALVGTPFFSGFYSKEHIIEAAGAAHVWGASFAYYATLIGVFVTSLYSFRVYFLVFHGKERFDTSDHGHGHGHDAHGHDDHGHDDHGHHGGKPHESPWVVTLPLILLAIPSVLIGAWAVDPMLFGKFFNGVITVLPQHPAMHELHEEWHGWVAFGLHAFQTLPFWLVVAGAVIAWYCYLINPKVPAAIKSSLSGVNKVLENKYYVDWVNEQIIARGLRCLGRGLWQTGDRGIIDGLLINGSARVVGWVSAISRHLQSGFIYHYAFAMIIGIMALVTFFVLIPQ
ncbi:MULTISPECIES: NADH-quinone oxidoreductase subunit L [Achromobacter]|jgi:NADH-quinone oxidoreductase subunit L|uniref:NADH-quinone oxidoreductase subunit L n=2 Tax=Alcaligenes xylosoxydans xylosoxydans TaxID=85698 RepID=A0A0D6GJ52_ALCXX|nr:MULTISPECIES: NADH-quinone oxidoreductase subunit L [Achromobacter]MBQ2647565.1 NADH-quinone oxidoreductase subunit L [Achromobacter sp.]AHC45850.1 NADH-ubiquinone oxidoreductase chain L [Achromobacter xylosoxidans NBRC 15126 = ATCC 27061]AMH06250.1 NADH-quinone oxidoreductase subunit L [Achromobacter xylosoxidans]EFV82599.1 NADH-ubiquinone oxidoreductase [Achromobacter xylosoxidans C54]KOQ27539.1 NADH:ubiquinone oxidoreductase subunit L [Achromobacter xylosoxidans]